MRCLSILLFLTLCITSIASGNDSHERQNYNCYAITVPIHNDPADSNLSHGGLKITCERLDGSTKTQLLKTYLITYYAKLVDSHREVTCNSNFDKDYIIVIPQSLTGTALWDSKGGIFIPFGNNVPPTTATTDIKSYFILDNDEKLKPKQKDYKGCIRRE